MAHFIRSNKKDFSFLKPKIFQNKKSFINFKKDDFCNENEARKTYWIRVTCRIDDPKCLSDIVQELEEILLKYGTKRVSLKAINPMFNDGRLDFCIELLKQESKTLYKNYNKIVRYNIKCVELDKVNVPAIFPKEWESHIKIAIEKRFSKNELTGESTLDLSDLANDATLKQQGLLLKLSNHHVMKYVMNMLKEVNLKSVTKINFSNNEISTTFEMESFFSKCMVLEVDLSNNRLSKISDMNFLSKNMVTSLNIVYNNFMRKINPRKLQDEIKKMLPSLTFLNGRALPANIVVAGEIPKVKKVLPEAVYSDKNSDVHSSFVLKYCQEFDNNIRDGLLDFYSTESVMSLACYSDEMPYSYRSMNSNIKNSHSSNIFKRGKAEIGAIFSVFPKTRHVTETLNVDVLIRTNSHIMFTLTGIFIELPEKSSKRYRPREFSRTILVTNGIILQDHLSLMSNDSNLIVKYKGVIDKLIEDNDFADKYKDQLKNLSIECIEIVKQFKSFTGMTISACLELLSAVGNLPDAIQRFTQMKENGEIPNIAYDK